MLRAPGLELAPSRPDSWEWPGAAPRAISNLRKLELIHVLFTALAPSESRAVDALCSAIVWDRAFPESRRLGEEQEPWSF